MRSSLIFSAVIALPVLTFAGTMGPLDPLYFTTSGGNLYKVQGNTVQSAPEGNPGFEGAIAVTNTVRTVGWDNCCGVNGGTQYTLNLAQTGTTYANTLGAQLLDGTSDGFYNYAVLWNDTAGNTTPDVDQVYRFNLDWTNPTYLFTAIAPDTLGISYDAVNNSLWTLSRTGKSVSDYSMAGGLLGGFATPVEDIGLAYDPGDGTLWASTWGGGSLYQYTTAGAVLNTPTYAFNLSNNAYGMEFAESGGVAPAAPEPNSWILSACGTALLACGMARRKPAGRRA